MRQQTIKVKLYTIDELKPDVQLKVLQQLRDINTDLDLWFEPVQDDWAEKLTALGYTNINIMFTGFYSQGDGACFTADVDIDKWLKAHKLANKFRKLYNRSEEVSIKITHSNRYYYSTSTNVSGENYTYDEKPDGVGAQMDAVVELIEKEREDLGDKIYEALGKANDYLTSDEAVKETIKENNYEFLESGARSIEI